MRAGASEAKIAEVTTALTSDLFDESEKTALEYAEAITFTDRKVTEELFARVPVPPASQALGADQQPDRMPQLL